MTQSQQGSVPHEWQLLGAASNYDLSDRTERKRSNTDLISLFFALLHTVKPDLFVEVGAFKGDTSMRVKRRHPDARVVAFEANPNNHSHFYSRFQHDKRGVEYLNMAVADKPGDITFKVIREMHGRQVAQRVGRSSLLARNDATVVYDDVIVKAVTLDTFFATDTSNRCAMWVDVEGAIGLVIGGAQEFLKKVELIMVEVEETNFWEGQWLAADVVKSLAAYGLLPIARDFESPTGLQYNMVFTRANRLSDSSAMACMIDYFSRSAHPASATETAASDD